MKKLLLVSDNHKEEDIIYDLIAIYKDEVDNMVHLGDSEFDDLAKAWQEMVPIKGNNDFGQGYIDETCLQLGKHKVFLTHGHEYEVGSSRDQLAHAARDQDCQFACYGHTHRPKCEYIDGVVLINPGSISQPRGKIKEKLYAILKVDKTSYQLDYFDHNHQMYEELSFQGKI